MAKSVEIPTTATPPSLPPLLDNLFPLYAGNLHPNVTEGDLYTLFSTIGPVHSVRLCRDRSTGKSLRYGYVNFYLPSNAVAALRDLNHSELRGKPIRVMWVEKDPTIRNNEIGNLFVKNLDLKVNEGKLEEIFGVFGWIRSCKIAKDDDGNSKGFGFVQFYSEESASNALSALNGSVFEGKIMTVAKYLKKVERNEAHLTNLYVKNLDESFTESSLKERFSEYGEVTSAVIMNDEQGTSRGFGFVNFESHENAAKAIEALNGTQIGTKKWFVGKAMMKAQRDASLGRAHQEETPKVSNLFVRNLATSVTEKDLKEVFGAFGIVTLVKVVYYENGVSKGVALVGFSQPEEAKKAMDSLNGSFYHGKYMNVSLALSREEIAKRLQTAFALSCTVPLTQMASNLQNLVEKPAKNSNLFVRNLATSVTEKDLKEVFGAFGCVTLAKVVFSKGVALVCFTKPDEAKKAMGSLNGSVYHGMSMNVSLALSKEEIAKFLKTKCTPLTHMASDLQKSVENPAKKEEPANGACSCDDNEDDGFVLVM
uniref:polyadenylate-binding protein 2-like n=1 Tax=Erigeron canadensis TaxID=72917 RepID=UPI001CB8C1E4|nr:polyadenylate-binding protein 2-like [Erigeron canadensis]